MPPLPLSFQTASSGHTALSLAPGVVACIAVAALAYGLETAEAAFLGRAWLEALVLAILLGTVIRSLWTPPASWQAGIDFSARTLLEIAVVLLGASLSAATLQAAGPGLLIGIAGTVALAILISVTIGRLLGLQMKMALLIACGNSICGNSAIAAIAPVIDADSDDVAASIAFTAVLGVAVVLALPLAGLALGLGAVGYGAFAGLTVYAVPQVIAAAAPFGLLAVQMGTLVKLVRVLMLGPVCLVLSLVGPRLCAEGDESGNAVPDIAGDGARDRERVGIGHLVPWFIIGFLAMAGLRSLGLIPAVLLPGIATAATLLTVVSMAALGLGVDIRTVARAGGRVIAAAALSLAALGVISLLLLHSLGLA